MKEDKEQITNISDLSNMVQDVTYVKMELWHCYTPRAKLLFIKGDFTGDELEAAFNKCESKGSEKDFPNFEIICKPRELVDFAKKILNFYFEYENANY